ncbi:S1 family peptidase [Tychonema sp. BBK16]|nr:serine protease [Tychonema sp. BBK16]MCF6372062.1 serine protease [Tychonema sp. BBK16]
MNWVSLVFFSCTAGVLTGIAIQVHSRDFSATELVRTDLAQQPQGAKFELKKLPVKSPVAQPLNLPAKSLKTLPGENQKQSLPQTAEDLAEKAMFQKARSITVKVLSGDNWGSGIIIQQQKQVYTVITNDHVLQSGDAYRIQTPDGKIYSATRYLASQFVGKDLALVQFSSTKSDYKIGVLGNSSALKEGDKVYAAGFPSELKKSDSAGWKFTDGRVSLIPEKSLEDGYQLGYDNQIEKGMSGGPVLNWAGEVVAVNGMHAYPLWGDPYLFQDGSKPCEPMRELMVRSSWGIPIEKFLQSAPQFSTKIADKKSKDFSSKPASPLLVQQSKKSNSKVFQPVGEAAKLMQKQAAAAKSCTQF